MTEAKVEYAKSACEHIIRLSGDIRYDSILPLHDLLERMLDDSLPIVLDLSHAELLDSTALGIMALVAKRSRRHQLPAPQVYVTSGTIIEVLEGVCFDKVFEILKCESQAETDKLSELHPLQLSLSDVAHTVKVAHSELAEMDVKNQLEFQEVNKILAAM